VSIIELENGGVVRHAYLSNSSAEFAHIPSRADQGVVLAIKDEQWATWWVMRCREVRSASATPVLAPSG
jgi:hypothetical protein